MQPSDRTDPFARLAELGLTLPGVVPPVGSYIPAVQTGSYVYTSGQLPMVNGALPHTGLVGVNVSVEQGAELARAACLNALAAIDDLVGLAAVVRVVKVVGFVACGPEFTAHPKVVNGASDLLGELFGDAGIHARSAIGVASLPLGAPVEIEMVVEVAV